VKNVLSVCVYSSQQLTELWVGGNGLSVEMYGCQCASTCWNADLCYSDVAVMLYDTYMLCKLIQQWGIEWETCRLALIIKNKQTRTLSVGFITYVLLLPVLISG
jgi:hypothetical protein